MFRSHRAEVQEADMAGVDVALQGLEPVALPHHEADREFIALVQFVPVEMGKGRRHGFPAQVHPDDSVFLDHVQGAQLDPGLVVRLRGLARHLHALAVQREFPTVIDAADPAFLVAPVEE